MRCPAVDSFRLFTLDPEHYNQSCMAALVSGGVAVHAVHATHASLVLVGMRLFPLVLLMLVCASADACTGMPVQAALHGLEMALNCLQVDGMKSRGQKWLPWVLPVLKVGRRHLSHIWRARRWALWAARCPALPAAPAASHAHPA